jgi:acyl dehydratase
MPLDYAKLRARVFEPVTQRYTRKDTILYALGVGAGQLGPTDPSELRLTYEDGLQALPTMAVVLANGPFWIIEPQWGIDWKRMLHGEQMLTVHRPLPPEGTVTAVEGIDEIYDKGADKGALMYLSKRLVDERGELLVEVRASAFLRGNGGFGGPIQGAPQPYPVPADRPAEATLELPTRADQALLYRLSGDFNPLHIDPRVAAAAGFERPILHGLCSYGIAGRALIKLFCANDPARVRRLDVRFASPVFPGETLRTEVWSTGPGTVAFRCLVVERNVVVINNGRFEFQSEP